MTAHLSEEEQIESLKRWWSENGMQTILTLVLLVGGYFGWQSWGTYQEEKTAQASDIYLEMLDVMSGLTPGQKATDEQQSVITEKADQLKSDHSGTQYARYAAMLKARLAVDNKDYDAAVAELAWAIEDDPDPALERIIRLRLARVEAARGNVETALQMLQGVDSAEMRSSYEEAKGDFYLQLGNRDAAFTAYQSARDSLQGQDAVAGSILRLKISQVQPVETDEPDSSEVFSENEDAVESGVAESEEGAS